MHVEAVFTALDDVSGALVQLTVGRRMQVEAPMPNEVLVPTLSSLAILLFLIRYVSNVSFCASTLCCINYVYI